MSRNDSEILVRPHSTLTVESVKMGNRKIFHSDYHAIKINQDKLQNMENYKELFVNGFNKIKKVGFSHLKIGNKICNFNFRRYKVSCH